MGGEPGPSPQRISNEAVPGYFPGLAKNYGLKGSLCHRDPLSHYCFASLWPNPLAIIAKVFPWGAVCLELGKQRLECVGDLGSWNEVLADKVEAVPYFLATYKDDIFIARATNKADFGLIGTNTSVRTARHPHAKLLIFQSEVAHDDLKLVDQGRKGPFRFANGQ